MRTYVFVDLETSGLDPQIDRIVEIAWMYADEKLRRLMDTSHTPVQPVGAALDRINSSPEVLDMHTRTGLLDELKKPDLPLLQSVETVICEELDAINERYQRYLTTLNDEANINVIAYSTDWKQAGGNVFTLGFLPFDQIERVVKYASLQNIRRVGVLAPNSEYGQITVSSYQNMAGRSG